MILSVVIITFNEEKNIRRCLESIQGIADEIIVVDSFSTDLTKEICKDFKVKFLLHPFDGYIEQKNFALTCASNDYVFSIDADEMLSEELKQSITDLKKGNVSYDAFSMNRCSSFCGKWIRHGSWYPDRKIRLFNKQKGQWSGMNPHDKIEMNNAASLYHLKGDLLHYSYYSLEEVITQNNKFTTIQAKAMFQQGKRSGIVKLAINPLIAFINGYIFKLGFLDGVDGFFIASSVAYQTMVKYAKLLHLHRDKS